MPRKKLIRSDFYPYHVTNRTTDRKFYPIPLERLWRMYADQLRIVAWAFDAKIHAFVLMCNHYHLLVSTPSSNLDEIVQHLQSEISSELCRELESKAFRFETRYHWSLIRNRNYFWNVYRYIYQNPIRATVAASVAEYPYSTFHGRAGYSRLDVPLEPHDLCDDVVFNTHIWDEEVWLNTPLDPELLHLIRKGNKHHRFGLARREVARFERLSRI